MYISRILDEVVKNNPAETTFHQAVTEVLGSLGCVIETNDMYRKNAVLERIVEPERIVCFRVPWIDDSGAIQVNKGYRVQFNSAIGPYKGGIRFNKTVDLGVMKFLAFEQTFKNSLTGLPMGGGKGGSNFEPKGKSDGEIMRFCQSFMSGLYKHIGPNEDVPAGDMGVSAREIGYMFGQYKRLTGRYESVLTGKGLSYGGSLVRAEATGYGLIYFTEEALRANDDSDPFAGKTVVISGSGNVAIYATEKAMQLGAKVVALSDTDGFIYDEDGIDDSDLEFIKDLKNNNRGRLSEYGRYKPGTYFENGSCDKFRKIWGIPCDIALPCATENELFLEDAKELVKNGCVCVGEGANMPCSLEATKFLQENGVVFLPSKAANAGGVATSGLEISQNSMRLSWSFDEVNDKLKVIMKNIFAQVSSSAIEYNQFSANGRIVNYVAGANIAGFTKVAEAMIAQGAV